MQELNESPLWWNNTLPIPMTHSSLPERSDVVVVGGGFSGISAALELRRSGIEVAVIDKAWPGNGACSRNMGFVMDRIAGTITGDLNTSVHGVKRHELVSEGLRAYNFVLNLIEREQIDCSLRQRGKLVLATSKSIYQQMAANLDRVEKHYGTNDAYMIPREDLSTEISGEAGRAYHGAKVQPNHHDLNPGQLIAALIQRASKLGARLHEATQLNSVQRLADGTFHIETNRGAIKAQHVVIATQGYTDKEIGFLNKKVFPSVAHVVATKPLPKGLMKQLLPNLRGVVDTKQMFFNFRPCHKEERLLLASNYLRTDDAKTQSMRILKSYRKLFPDLADVKAEYCWKGYLPLTANRLPHISSHEGMHFCVSGCIANSMYLGAKIAKRIIDSDGGKTIYDGMALKNFPLYSGNPSLLTHAMRMVLEGMDYLNIADGK